MKATVLLHAMLLLGIRVLAKLNLTSHLPNKGLGKLNTKIEMGIQSRASIISGHVSTNGTGVLSGVKMPGW